MSARPDGWKPYAPRLPYWPAKWPGECQACPAPITEGEEIMRADAGGYVHVTCPVAPKADKFDGTSDKEMGF
jgi:hypothetical protein